MADTIAFTEEAVKAYLDAAITSWRKRRDGGDEIATYYVDAYQSVRTSIFGGTLDEGEGGEPPEPSEWWPKIGDEVWYNYPDHPDPIGKVIGFVPEDGRSRAGQPVIERYEGETRTEFGFTVPDKVVIHPRFLLPFAYHGPEWLEHEKAGMIR